MGAAPRIGLGVMTFGGSEAAIAGYNALNQGPDTVNYQGKKLTDSMKDYLADLSRQGDGSPWMKITGQSGAARSQEILRNWLFGPPVKPLDPTLAFSQANALTGAKTQAGLGMGMSGAFDFGLPKLPSLDLGPMARGVPYSVPPLPTLRPR